eukprot:357747_1
MSVTSLEIIDSVIAFIDAHNSTVGEEAKKDTESTNDVHTQFIESTLGFKTDSFAYKICIFAYFEPLKTIAVQSVLLENMKFTIYDGNKLKLWLLCNGIGGFGVSGIFEKIKDTAPSTHIVALVEHMEETAIAKVSYEYFCYDNKDFVEVLKYFCELIENNMLWKIYDKNNILLENISIINQYGISKGYKLVSKDIDTFYESIETFIAMANVRFPMPDILNHNDVQNVPATSCGAEGLFGRWQ